MALSQRSAPWNVKPLGKGVGGSTIGDFGCFLVSLDDGMRELGYKWNPHELSEALLKKGLWDNSNYIIVDSLAKLWPEVFTGFRRHEPFTDMTLLQSYLDQGAIVVAKVDAKGIGGSGTHFVRVLRIEGANAIVMDPWFGDIIKVAQRYNKYGNILGLRVFFVKKLVISTTETMPDNNTNSIIEEMKRRFRVSGLEEFIAKTEEHCGVDWGDPNGNGGYLGSERKNNKVFQITIDNQKIEIDNRGQLIKQANDHHSDYVEKLLKIVNSFGNPLGLSDEDLVIKIVNDLVARESQFNIDLKKQESAWQQKQKDLLEKNAELQRQLDRFSGDIQDLQNAVLSQATQHKNEIVALEKKHKSETDKLNNQIIDLQNQLKRVKTDSVLQKSEQQGLDLISQLIQKIKTLLTKEKNDQKNNGNNK